MCNFFSFLVDDKHNFHHFAHAQRLSEVKLKNGKPPLYDSHASIAEFYGIKEDNCNKYEYNPFTDELTLDYQNMEESKEETLAFVHSINWYDFCGDIGGFKKFLASIKDIPFMQNNSDFDLSGCKVFDTVKEASIAARHAAEDAAWLAARNAAEDAACEAAFDAAKDAARGAAWDAAWAAARDVIRDVIRSVAWKSTEDLVLYAVIKYVCADLPIPQKHIDYINKLYAIWLNGYGVLYEVDGVFYVYRRP